MTIESIYKTKLPPTHHHPGPPHYSLVASEIHPNVRDWRLDPNQLTLFAYYFLLGCKENERHVHQGLVSVLSPMFFVSRTHSTYFGSAGSSRSNKGVRKINVKRDFQISVRAFCTMIILIAPKNRTQNVDPVLTPDRQLWCHPSVNQIDQIPYIRTNFNFQISIRVYRTTIFPTCSINRAKGIAPILDQHRQLCL